MFEYNFKSIQARDRSVDEIMDIFEINIFVQKILELEIWHWRISLHEMESNNIDKYRKNLLFLGAH